MPGRASRLVRAVGLLRLVAHALCWPPAGSLLRRGRARPLTPVPGAARLKPRHPNRASRGKRIALSRWGAVVHIERNELAELLRSRGNDQTAVRAEQSLPQHIDLQRDREALRQCGIDPNVLAYILSTQVRTTDVTEPPSQPAADLDDRGGGSARIEGAPRTVRAQNRPTGSGAGTAVGTTNVSQRSLQSPSSSDHRTDQMTTRSTSATKEKAVLEVTSKPAFRCPRCKFVFGSPALMLDHLNAHHRNADRLTHESAESDGVRHTSRGAHVALMPTADPVLANLQLAYRRSRKFLEPRRLVIGIIILAYLLSFCVVAILT
jgi:hypothetical protein